jgi:hypothetical protein
MSWGAPIRILEGEDEAALKQRFIDLCARWPDRTPEEVGAYVFSDLVDPVLRGQHAGLTWSRQLEVQEAIRLLRLSGGSVSELPSKEQLVSEVLAIARNERVDAKERNGAYKLALEAMGLITKQVDKTVNDNRPPPPPAFVIARYDD